MLSGQSLAYKGRKPLDDLRYGKKPRDKPERSEEKLGEEEGETPLALHQKKGFFVGQLASGEHQGKAKAIWNMLPTDWGGGGG